MQWEDDTAEIQRTRVIEFIARHNLMVIASKWQGRPQAAVVAFTECNGVELIFGTFCTSRKYRNMKAEPAVAVVIGWDENITVQLEGTAIELGGTELIQQSTLNHSNDGAPSA